MGFSQSHVPGREFRALTQINSSQFYFIWFIIIIIVYFF